MPRGKKGKNRGKNMNWALTGGLKFTSFGPVNREGAVLNSKSFPRKSIPETAVPGDGAGNPMEGGASTVKGRGKKLWGKIFSSDEPEVSMIGEGMSVVGTLLFGDGVVRLDGHLEGKIIGPGTLVIGEKGSLQGEVEVGTLILGGLVEGIVLANGSAHITPTGKLFGKILTSDLVIDRGGIFEGEGEARTLTREPVIPGKNG
jgi:cytoskeletal protein CcmA (bactofilin family)